MATIEKTRFPESTAVRANGYADERQELEVTFTSGAVYIYFGVPPYVFARFRSAESAGKFFNDEILDRYPFRRLKKGRSRRPPSGRNGSSW